MNLSKISWKIIDGVICRKFKIYSAAYGKTSKIKVAEGNVVQKVQQLECKDKEGNKKVVHKSEKTVGKVKANSVKAVSKTGNADKAGSDHDDSTCDKTISEQEQVTENTDVKKQLKKNDKSSNESAPKQSKDTKEKTQSQVSTKSEIVPCQKFDGKLIGTCKTAKISKPVRDENTPCPKIAILGAGMAGLTAALRLHEAGLNNFTVYEASMRVGGRIFSAWSGEGINEYGAEWIEGETNPILALASQEGLTVCRDSPKQEIYANGEGKPVMQVHVDESKANWKKVVDEGVKTYCSNSEDEFLDYSLLDFIKRQKTKFNWKSEEAKVLFESMSYGSSCRLGGPSNEISLNDLGAKFRYESRFSVKEGVVAVLAPMLKIIPETKIQLNRRVQIIQWDECPVKLIFDDCSVETADIVLVTFSLGVLKKDTELFEPELPPDKIEAIENTGFAPVNKIFLDYADPFWLKGEATLFLSRKIDHETTQWEDAIYKIREIYGGNNTLEVSLCGQPAVEVERYCEEEVAIKITKLLRQFTGVAITPFPIALSKSCWSNDPLFMGSMSFMGKTTNKRHLRALGLPIPLLSAVPTILFAGDYTACGEIGTLKGARLSGFREAQRIVDVISHLGWPPRQRNANYLQIQ